MAERAPLSPAALAFRAGHTAIAATGIALLATTRCATSGKPRWCLRSSTVVGVRKRR
jgi:hypothetical protein